VQSKSVINGVKVCLNFFKNDFQGDKEAVF